VKLRFSGHAKRRARLYKISESTITDILASMNFSAGQHEIVKEIPGSKFPLKIVISVEDDMIEVVTNYPLKKGRRR